MLKIVADINRETLQPRPLDLAVVSDVFKIREGVDKATALAVGAANGLSPSTLVNVNGATPNFHSLGRGSKLSKERRRKMREVACQRLADAYRLDEVACSVLTMQSSSALEEVGDLVLQQNRQDLDAKYVHFFHEKIPSKKLVETTSLQPLTDLIESNHGQAEALRTRAAVKVFREDFEGAVADLTEALNLSRYHGQPRGSDSQGNGYEQSTTRNSTRNHDISTSDQDQPRGLVAQLLFQRASVYIIMACRHVDNSIDPSPPDQTVAPEIGHPVQTSTGAKDVQEIPKEQLESRRLVKNLAKRALKDYTTFLSHFDYSPNLPIAVITEFNYRMNQVSKGVRKPTRSHESNKPLKNHSVYPLSVLFAAVPPPDVPAYPLEEVSEINSTGQRLPEPNTSELVTYHPLLTEALHALLLCHCLVQTSTKELQRHAYMVARLVRLCDGFPIFKACRSPARSDWVKVLRRTKRLSLVSTWETLCTPPSVNEKNAHESLSSAAASLLKDSQAAISTLEDESNKSLEKPSQEDTNNPPGGLAPLQRPRSSFKHDPSPDWNTDEDSKEYPFLTERSAAVVKWTLHAPIVPGTAKRKKRPKKSGIRLNGVEADVEKLHINE